MSSIPAALWGPAAVILAGVIGWVLKRVLWDPITELKAAQAAFVTRSELEMEVQELARKIDAGRVERDEGEKRLRRDFDGMRRENATQRTEVRTDIQNLVKRIDQVMQNQSRH